MPQEQQGASDNAVSSFLALDEGKKREALGKLSDPAKQALLVGIQSRKPPTQPTVEQRMPFQSGVAAGVGLDPTKLAQQPTAKRQVAEVGKQLSQGMSTWMESVAKDPLHITDPFEALAKGLEFHIAGHDPFGVGKTETPIDEIVSSLKSGDHAKLMHGSGKMLGTLAGLFGAAETKDVPGKVKAAGETARAVPFALDKAKVVAASNEVLQGMADTAKAQIVDAVKKTGTAIGADVQNIAAADRAASQTVGKAGSFVRNDVVTSIAKTVQDMRAEKTSLPGTSTVIKALGKYGTDLTWEDVKDLRQIVDKARQGAGGKDSAILGKTYKDFESMLSARAKEVGKEDQFNRYVETTTELRKHRDGILKKLDNTPTGIKFFDELTKPSNRPLLDSALGLLSKNSSLSPKLIDELIKSHNPIAILSASADGKTSALAGRLQALARHPAVAGPVGAATMMSPLPAKYILSLLTMGKAGELMDRLDAAVALRRLQGVEPTVPAVVGKSPSTTSPTAPSAPAPTTPVAPPSAPPTPSSAASRIVSEAEARRVAKAKAAPQPKVEPSAKLTEPVAPMKVEAKPVAKAKAYEAFGVTIDPTQWKTPEDVIAGKRAAHAQLESEIQKRGLEIQSRIKSGELTREAAQPLADKLIEEHKKAAGSIDKIQTPEIGSKARDVLRKRGQVRAATAEVGREQVAKEQASGNVQEDIDNGMAIEKYTKLLQALKLGKVVDKITNAHFDKYDTNYELLAKQLQAVYEGVTKK